MSEMFLAVILVRVRARVRVRVIGLGLGLTLTLTKCIAHVWSETVGVENVTNMCMHMWQEGRGAPAPLLERAGHLALLVILVLLVRESVLVEPNQGEDHGLALLAERAVLVQRAERELVLRERLRPEAALGDLINLAGGGEVR